MLRTISFVFLLACSCDAKALSNCQANGNDFCWGNYGDKWCYLTNDGNKDHAKSNTGKMKGYKCSWFNGHDHGKYCENGKGHKEEKTSYKPTGKGVGAFIAQWALKQYGRSIGNGQCTELAVHAIKAARKAGYDIPAAYSKYTFPKWSAKIVKYTDVRPGDIAQFSNWRQNKGGYFQMTGVHHTAVVVKPWDHGKKGIVTYDQNPGPVKQTIYYPGHRSQGTVKIYRIVETKRLLQRFTDMGDSIVERMSSWSIGGLAIVSMAGLGFMMVMALRVLSKRRRFYNAEALIMTEDPTSTCQASINE